MVINFFCCCFRHGLDNAIYFRSRRNPMHASANVGKLQGFYCWKKASSVKDSSMKNEEKFEVAFVVIPVDEELAEPKN